MYWWLQLTRDKVQLLLKTMGFKKEGSDKIWSDRCVSIESYRYISNLRTQIVHLSKAGLVLQEYWPLETSSAIPLSLSGFLPDLSFLGFKSLVFLVYIPTPLRFHSLHLAECLSFLRKPAGRRVSWLAEVTQYLCTWLNLKGLDKCCILKVWEVLPSSTVEFRQAINGKSRQWKISLCHEQRSYIPQRYFFILLKMRKALILVCRYCVILSPQRLQHFSEN